MFVSSPIAATPLWLRGFRAPSPLLWPTLPDSRAAGFPMCSNTSMARNVRNDSGGSGAGSSLLRIFSIRRRTSKGGRLFNSLGVHSCDSPVESEGKQLAHMGRALTLKKPFIARPACATASFGLGGYGVHIRGRNSSLLSWFVAPL